MKNGQKPGGLGTNTGIIDTGSRPNAAHASVRNQRRSMTSLPADRQKEVWKEAVEMVPEDNEVAGPTPLLCQEPVFRTSPGTTGGIAQKVLIHPNRLLAPHCPGNP